MRLYTTLWLALGTTLSTSLLFGCEKDAEKSDADVEETGVDISKNPFGALQQLADAGKEMQKKAEEMKQKKPIAPVKFDALVPLLPAPEGWAKNNEPRAQTTQMGEYQISTATQNYEKGDGNERQRMKVSIVDGGYVAMVYAPFLMMSKFSHEGTDGHSKGLTVDGHPAFEEWKKNQRRVTLTILVRDRFLITLEGNDVDEKAARDWAKHIPLGKLAKWAEDKVTGGDVSPTAEDEKPEADSTKAPAPAVAPVAPEATPRKKKSKTSPVEEAEAK